MEKNVPEHPSKEFIILSIITSIICFAIGYYNNPNDSIIGLILVSVFGGIILAVILIILFLWIKNMFRK